MKPYIRKLFYILSFVLMIHVVLYVVFNYINSSADSSDSIFVFGDSQTVYGLDLKEFRKELKYNFYSAAQPGSGVYDFFVFVDKIPSNSKVIMSVSKLAQIRPYEGEANTSPLNYNAFVDMYSLGYNRNGLETIFMRNLNLPVAKYYKSNFTLFPKLDTLVTSVFPLKYYKKRYSISKEDLIKKQDCYIQGIKMLIEKNCEITFIEFPFHPSLMEIDKDYKYRSRFSEFKNEISSLYMHMNTDTIQLPTNENLMYDYCHLNEDGANLATKELTDRFTKKQYPTWYIIRWRDKEDLFSQNLKSEN